MRLLEDSGSKSVDGEPPMKKKVTCSMLSFESSSESEEEDADGSNAMNELAFWKMNGKSMPNLAVVANKYLSIPATSVPVEHLFSKAGELISKKRNLLNPGNADTLLSSAC